MTKIGNCFMCVVDVSAALLFNILENKAGALLFRIPNSFVIFKKGSHQGMLCF